MDFELPKEIQDLQSRCRKFVEQEMIPLETEWPAHDEDAPPEKEKAGAS
jgi:hypothetical protein